MRIFTKTTVVALLMLMAGTVLAATDDPMARLVGAWISPDGAARQQVERCFNGSWLITRQWFHLADGWVLVGRGAMYQKPGQSSWVSVNRTTEMGGIVLFESTLHPGRDLFTVENRAYMEDGSVVETEEEWRFPSADQIDYIIYRLTEEGRSAWMKGSWQRQQEEAR